MRSSTKLAMRRRQLEGNKADFISRLDRSIHETRRVADIAANVNAIYDAYDEEFSRKTGLTKSDWVFLFTAIGLQVLRQYLLTRFPERLDDQAAAEEVEGVDRIKADRLYRKDNPRKHRYYNPSLAEIIGQPVPFDANRGADGALSGAGSLGHRGATPGHDPLVGLVVGTANIATSTLTNWHFQSWHIETGTMWHGGNVDQFGNNANTVKVFGSVVDKILHQGNAGRAKVVASLGKEIIHLKTDENTKNSLPLPVIGTLSPKLASSFADYGLDFANVKTFGKQMAYAVLINQMIAFLHRFFYKEDRDGALDLYKVRTQKILMYSNAIAVGTNALVVAFTKNFKLWDAGGSAVAFYQLVTGARFIESVREDFIANKFDQLINKES